MPRIGFLLSKLLPLLLLLTSFILQFSCSSPTKQDPVKHYTRADTVTVYISWDTTTPKKYDGVIYQDTIEFSPVNHQIYSIPGPAIAHGFDSLRVPDSTILISALYYFSTQQDYFDTVLAVPNFRWQVQ